jgi:Ca2+-binding EF-hand superfamily protein
MQAIHSGATLSQSDFENLVAQFGGTKAQADQLFQGFNTNGDGSVSYEESLNGLVNASKDESGAFAQSLFGLMDTDGSGSVSALEFGTFEAAFIKAEKVET